MTLLGYSFTRFVVGNIFLSKSLSATLVCACGTLNLYSFFSLSCFGGLSLCSFYNIVIFMEKEILCDTVQKQQMFDALQSMKKINALEYSNTSSYTVVDSSIVLDSLISEHDVIVVGGSFFGDEGKGKLVDAIARDPRVTMIARVNSGSNAGHTVVLDGKKFVFHLVPSGILVDGLQTFIGCECVMDPLEFMEKEIQALVDASFDYKKKLFIGNVHIVTPYHKLMDVIRNLGDVSSDTDVSTLKLNNASTLKGIAPIHMSKVNKSGARLNDLFGERARLKKIFAKDLHNYVGMLLSRGLDEMFLLKVCQQLNADGNKRVPDYIIDFLEAEDKVAFLVELYDTYVVHNSAFPQRRYTRHVLQEGLALGQKVLLEGPQSFFLSNSIDRHWTSGTSANTTCIGILASSGVNIMQHKACFINIHKAPGSSRVGRGANPAGHVLQTFYSDRGINTLNDLEPGTCDDFSAIQKQFWDSIAENGLFEPTTYTDATGSYSINVAMAIGEAKKFGERGATTLKPRVTGLFDCVAHAMVMREQGPYTCISAVDRGDNFDEIGLVVAYVYYHPDGLSLQADGITYENGTIITCNDVMPHESILGYCYPIIKKIKGWNGSPIAYDKWKGGTLPLDVQNFVGCIEHFTGARVIAIGNGPEAHHILYIEKNT